MSDRLLYWLFAASLVVAVALFGKTAYDYQRYRMLLDDGRIAAATISDVRPAVRNRLGTRGRWQIDYRFAVPGDEVVGRVGVPREVAAQYHAGQHIDVIFAPDDPSLSALYVEQAWAVVIYDEWVLVPYLALAMVLLWNVLERRRRR